MDLYGLLGTEDHPAYRDFEVENNTRLHGFMRSAVISAIAVHRPVLSRQIICALNFHAIACLHGGAGLYRPCAVSAGLFQPPEFHQVPELMDDFVNMVNRWWAETNPVVLATHVLWRLSYIHPFINGNGRTARAAAYYVLCAASGAWLPGSVLLPELLTRHRKDYIEALRRADQSHREGKVDLTPLHSLVQRLLVEQLSSVD